MKAEAVRRSVPPALWLATAQELAVELRRSGSVVSITVYRGVTRVARPVLENGLQLVYARTGNGYTIWGGVRDGVLYWMAQPHGVVE